MFTASIPDPQTYRVDCCGPFLVLFGLAGQDLALQAGMARARAEPDRDVLVIHEGRVLAWVARRSEQQGLLPEPSEEGQVPPKVLIGEHRPSGAFD